MRGDDGVFSVEATLAEVKKVAFIEEILSVDGFDFN